MATGTKFHFVLHSTLGLISTEHYDWHAVACYQSFCLKCSSSVCTQKQLSPLLLDSICHRTILFVFVNKQIVHNRASDVRHVIDQQGNDLVSSL
jgi:hypothetical protein